MDPDLTTLKSPNGLACVGLPVRADEYLADIYVINTDRSSLPLGEHLKQWDAHNVIPELSKYLRIRSLLLSYAIDLGHRREFRFQGAEAYPFIDNGNEPWRFKSDKKIESREVAHVTSEWIAILLLSGRDPRMPRREGRWLAIEPSDGGVYRRTGVLKLAGKEPNEFMLILLKGMQDGLGERMIRLG